MKKKRLSKKEKREIGLIVASVVLVLTIGLIVNYMESGHTGNIRGSAISLDGTPTLSGMLGLLNEYCYPVQGVGSCNALCGEDVCVPVEENCDEELVENQCLCCENTFS
jgi:hypothetical protein